MSDMKTPGVYIAERNPLAGAVVEVATAVPAFIGYTARAEDGGKSLFGVPWRIGSMAEFERFFGGAPPARFSLTEAADGAFRVGAQRYTVAQTGPRFRLYHGMRHYFTNGGGACWVVSVGDYTHAPSEEALVRGISALQGERESSLLVVPDAVSLALEACIGLQQQMLRQGSDARQRQRFAILDVPNGDQELDSPRDPVNDFCRRLGQTGLINGAAYFPYLDTTVVDPHEVDWRHIEHASLTGTVAAMVRADAQASKDVKRLLDAAELGDQTARPAGAAELHEALIAGSPAYGALMAEICRQMNRLGPCAAMAGVYAWVDHERGVWKAPANVRVAGVVMPAVPVSQEQQEGLNLSPQGQSINAIRSFVGEGVLVWGARTLDGNSLDGRYVNVRRTLMMVEESCRLACKALVFEPHVAHTWVAIQSMLGDFLTILWKRGGLAGAVPEQAFSVQCGLGETMTAEDVQQGILRVTVQVAVSRPAEFIEITFQQPMQVS
ncbi:phage tail sheath family protein [Inhella sp.]|uniref:phage tail sheath family protein n=1 Tax=Inhella sp. TaxID=1921806 RepID=UPI0035B02C14